MDYSNFVDRENGHQASTYYDSGRLTTGTISASLGLGTYYLVFDNSFAIISQKNVQV